MSAPFNTLYLDPLLWDLAVDANGNIAMAAPNYALVQDVASACRTFLGEVYYDNSIGVPYIRNPPGSGQELLGTTPPLSVLQGAMAAAALTVPYVQSATVVVTSFENREAQGQVQFTTQNGQSLQVTL